MGEDEYQNLKPGDLCLCEDETEDPSGIGGYYVILSENDYKSNTEWLDPVDRPRRCYTVFWFNERRRKFSQLIIPCYILDRSIVIQKS